MTAIKHVCFDLDGTLINSYDTIYKATLKTLEELEITTPFVETEFRNRIGHHFLDIFRELTIPVPDIEHFINIYKGHYFDFIEDSVVYPGVMDVVKRLQEQNIYVSLLTTKGQDQADKIIDHFGLREYFGTVSGRVAGMPTKPSPEPLITICQGCGVSAGQTIMVGDSELDIKCGKAAGAQTAGVSYGYRSRELLSVVSPDYIFDAIEELLDIII